MRPLQRSDRFLIAGWVISMAELVTIAAATWLQVDVVMVGMVVWTVAGVIALVLLVKGSAASLRHRTRRDTVALLPIERRSDRSTARVCIPRTALPLAS